MKTPLFNAAPMPPMFVVNSGDKLPDSGSLAVQIAPFGDFSGVMYRPGGEKRAFVQKLDAAAFDRILNAWKAAGSPELLVDADHTSCEGGSTKAYAWASNLRVVKSPVEVRDAPSRTLPAGLYADFRFTPAGTAAIDSREFRFVSPVFSLSENGDVQGLQSVALTNTPNLPVRCVLNSSAPAPTTVEETNKENPSMDEIKEALGLPADATDDQVVEAVRALVDAKAKADADALNSEAQAFADANKDRVENRDKLVELYVKNGKEVAEAFLGALKAPSKAVATPPPATRIVAKNAAAPATVATAGDPAARITARNKAVNEYMAAHRCKFQIAWSACRAADPELFAESSK